MKRWTVKAAVMVAMLAGLGRVSIADDAATRPSDSPATQPTPMSLQSAVQKDADALKAAITKADPQTNNAKPSTDAKGTGDAKAASDAKVSTDSKTSTDAANASDARPADDGKTSASAKTASATAAMKPAAAAKPTDAKTTDAKPTTPADPTSKMPTPAELITRMRQAQAAQARIPKVAFFDLTGPLLEKPADFSFFGSDAGLTLRSLIDRLELARHDTSVRGVLITLGDGGLNLSQALELRTELNSLRRDGKRTFVYADSYDTTSYLAACGATDICMMQGGDIMVPGVGFEMMFAKGLLDKVGVKADYVQIGEYKGADEEYTRATASEELRGELNKLADSLYGQIVDTISMSRNLSHEDVKELMDDALVTARVAKSRGLVDHLVELDGVKEMINTELGRKVEVLYNYGEAEKEQVDLSSPFAILSLLNKKPAAPTRDGIAIVYAEGVIVDGNGGESLLGGDGNIGSETIREALRMADRDPKIHAIVLRIDSPGGSALASEVMWQAVRRVAKNKPVVISIGSEAASGGYYLASSGSYIFADPTAIVGSIGVVGGKFVYKDLFDKLGVNTESFLRGRNANLFSSNSEWTDSQRRQVTGWMRETYDQFTERVMTTREGKIKDIDAVARGRIFSAKQAKDLGMIDRLGGVKDAIEYTARLVDLQPGEYDVRVLPPARTLSDLLAAAGLGGPDALSPLVPKLGIGADSLTGALPRSVRQSLGQQMQLLMLLQQRPIMLAAPYTLVVK
jgi:protease-4